MTNTTGPAKAGGSAVRQTDAGHLGEIYQKLLDLNARLETARNRLATVNDQIFGLVDEPECGKNGPAMEGFIGEIDQKVNFAHGYVSDIEAQIARISQLSGPGHF